MAEGSAFIRKEPCPKCGSRDNLARYSDGHAHCFTFGCTYFEKADGEERPTSRTEKKKHMARDLISGGEFRALTKRGITLETCQKFGYQVGKYNDKFVHIAPYFSSEGTLAAQKLRFEDKTFTVTGTMKECGLFGQSLWGTGKKVIVTEGEIDAMSVSQVQGNKWPVVSLQNGAQSAKQSLARSLEWLMKFDEIILMFDMDEPGRTASQEAAQMFPAGKCKIASLPMKDANEMLMAGKEAELISAIWNAKPYRPDSLLTFKDVIEAARKPVEFGLPWFSGRLTTLTYGRRKSEIYAFGAGTGIGKTDFLTQQITYDVVELQKKVGMFFLEQPVVESAKRLAGKLGGKRFHVPNGTWTQEELDTALNRLDNGMLFLYDNFGATDWQIIRNNMRYLNHAEGVEIFYLDHLTALAAAEQDERVALENIMAEMASLAKELNIIIHLVSHLSTPEGKPHEEGGRVQIRHFKGSRAIGFWCHYMFGLERDQQHEVVGLRTVTFFRVLKDRYTGEATGEIVYLGYDRETGRLFEHSSEEVHDMMNASEDQNEPPSPF